MDYIAYYTMHYYVWNGIYSRLAGFYSIESHGQRRIYDFTEILGFNSAPVALASREPASSTS